MWILGGHISNQMPRMVGLRPWNQWIFTVLYGSAVWKSHMERLWDLDLDVCQPLRAAPYRAPAAYSEPQRSMSTAAKRRAPRRGSTARLWPGGEATARHERRDPHGGLSRPAVNSQGVKSGVKVYVTMPGNCGAGEKELIGKMVFSF